MTGESTSLFKVFRVLWFPVSVNAIFLGALAVVTFVMVTWFANFLVGGRTSMTTAASGAFLPASARLITTGQWPGYATGSASEDGPYMHVGLLPDEDGVAPTETPAHVTDDIQFLADSFGETLAGYAAEVRAEIESLPEEERASALQSELETLAEYTSLVVPRYRVTYLIQLATFFALMAFFGVAISRVLVLRLARDEYCTLGHALGYAWDVKWTGLLFPPAVLVPIGFLWVCNLLAGLILGIPGLGWLLGIVVVPLLYLSSLLIFLIGLAGLASLGLLPATIATERESTYNSIGKTVNYVFARPLPLILYVTMVGLFIGLLHHTLIEREIVETVLTASVSPFWAGESFSEMLTGETSGLGGFEWFCGLFYALINTLWQLLVWGTLIAFTLGSSVSVFLILRREVDGVDYVDVARTGEED